MTAVDDVKSKIDIVDVIGQYAPLKKAGRTFKALCPFHNEKTPSFVVYPDQGTWRCFGACTTGGDVFKIGRAHV
jgi:DNA primase